MKFRFYGGGNNSGVIYIEPIMSKILIWFVIIGFVLNTSAFGQGVTASTTAQASIVQPLDLSKVRDLSFGNISAGETSGTVVLPPTVTSIRTASGGVTLPSGSGTVQSAKFIVSGDDSHSYSIILPSAAITLSDGTHFMTVDNFTSIPSGSGLLTSGSQIVYVGATLNVNAHQEAGDYISTQDFEVTVNYN
jgi:hypothetical protein